MVVLLHRHTWGYLHFKARRLERAEWRVTESRVTGLASSFHSVFVIFGHYFIAYLRIHVVVILTTEMWSQMCLLCNWTNHSWSSKLWAFESLYVESLLCIPLWFFLVVHYRLQHVSLIIKV